jgi:hypothetical protein
LLSGGRGRPVPTGRGRTLWTIQEIEGRQGLPSTVHPEFPRTKRIRKWI